MALCKNISDRLEMNIERGDSRIQYWKDAVITTAYMGRGFKIQRKMHTRLKMALNHTCPSALLGMGYNVRIN